MIALSAAVFLLLILPVHAENGVASVYWHGRKTANGEGFKPHSSELTAAHKRLPFGSRVRVTHKGNGRSIVVRINDRGPFIRGRIIDVTPPGAKALGFSGLAPVHIEVIR